MSALSAMPPLPAEPVPLRWDDGVWRIGSTNLTLEAVVQLYDSGLDADEIARDFDGLELASVYQTIGYYLRHREDLADYNAVLTSPTGARKARKGKREQLPARFLEVDAQLEGCDRLVVQLRGKSTDLPAVRAAKDAFVDGWFASRRIDDFGTGRSTASTPTPAPPAK